MPYYWKLKDSNGQTVHPALLDDQICAQLGVPSDPKKYLDCWWDIVGFGLIDGLTTQQIFNNAMNDPSETQQFREILKIVAQYQGEAWYSSGRG